MDSVYETEDEGKESDSEMNRVHDDAENRIDRIEKPKKQPKSGSKKKKKDKNPINPKKAEIDFIANKALGEWKSLNWETGELNLNFELPSYTKIPSFPPSSSTFSSTSSSTSSSNFSSTVSTPASVSSTSYVPPFSMSNSFSGNTSSASSSTITTSTETFGFRLPSQFEPSKKQNFEEEKSVIVQDRFQAFVSSFNEVNIVPTFHKIATIHDKEAVETILNDWIHLVEKLHRWQFRINRYCLGEIQMRYCEQSAHESVQKDKDQKDQDQKDDQKDDQKGKDQIKEKENKTKEARKSPEEQCVVMMIIITLTVFIIWINAFYNSQR